MDRNLIDYLPTAMREVEEIKVIAQVEQSEIEGLWKCTDDLLNDQFVADATENGVSRWERILKIVPKATEELDTRKFRILTRLNEQLPYTMRTMVLQLESLCGVDGYSVEVQASIYKLLVRVALTAKSNFDDVRSLLERVVPANMVIDLSLKYNQHITVGKLTHDQLTRFTYEEIRNEVLADGN